MTIADLPHSGVRAARSLHKKNVPDAFRRCTAKASPVMRRQPIGLCHRNGGAPFEKASKLYKKSVTPHCQGLRH
jgi:hypothetical protein